MSKFNNRFTVYNGTTYHSKKEAEYAMELELRVKAKDIKAWDRQIRIPLVVNGHKICIYVMDFKIIHNDDSIEFIEVKGFKRDLWKVKWKLLGALLPTTFPSCTLTLIDC